MSKMSKHEVEAYQMMQKALEHALNEIKFPGINQHSGIDIISHVEEVVKYAKLIGEND